MTITIARVQHNLPNAIYVGRRMWRYRSANVAEALISQITIGSALHNPYRASECDDPIGRFAVYLTNKVAQRSIFICTELQRLVYLADLTDITLACWCAAQPRAWYSDPTMHRDGCHADIVAMAVERIIEAKQVIV